MPPPRATAHRIVTKTTDLVNALPTQRWMAKRDRNLFQHGRGYGKASVASVSLTATKDGVVDGCS